MRNPFTQNSLPSLISGPIIWAAHFLICYVGVSLACTFGFANADMLIAGATAIALVLLAYVALANYRKWKEARRTHALDAESNVDASTFFSRNTMMFCGLSAIALAWVAVPAAVLPTCVA